MREKSMQNLLSHSAAWRGRGLEVPLPLIWPSASELPQTAGETAVETELLRPEIQLFTVNPGWIHKHFEKTAKPKFRRCLQTQHTYEYCRLDSDDECSRLEGTLQDSNGPEKGVASQQQAVRKPLHVESLRAPNNKIMRNSKALESKSTGLRSNWALAQTAASRANSSEPEPRREIQRRLVSGTCQVGAARPSFRTYLSALCLQTSSRSLRERSALFSARGEDTPAVQ